MHSSSSSACATTCSNWPTGWCALITAVLLPHVCHYSQVVQLTFKDTSIAPGSLLASSLVFNTTHCTQVGIYKTDNATKSVAINPADFVVGAAPEALPAAVPIAA